MSRMGLCLALTLLARGALAACGPDPAPSQAVAAGFNCETFWDGPFTLATIDVNNTKGPPWSAANPSGGGFKWYTDMNWPQSPGPQWQTMGLTSAADLSISGGNNLLFAPTAAVSWAPGSLHTGNIISCTQTPAAPFYRGNTFTGGWYYEVQATWPNGSVHTEPNWPDAWGIATTFLNGGPLATVQFTENDNFESAFQRNFHIWTYAGGVGVGGVGTPGDHISSCGGGTGTCGVPTSGHKWGLLLVPSVLGGGAPRYDWYRDDVLQATAGPPAGYAMSAFDFSAAENMCLIIGASHENPATFQSVRVWQQTPQQLLQGGKRHLW